MKTEFVVVTTPMKNVCPKIDTSQLMFSRFWDELLKQITSNII